MSNYHGVIIFLLYGFLLFTIFINIMQDLGVTP